MKFIYHNFQLNKMSKTMSDPLLSTFWWLKDGRNLQPLQNQHYFEVSFRCHPPFDEYNSDCIITIVIF